MKRHFIKGVIIFSIFITMFSSCGNSVSKEQLIGTWVYTNTVKVDASSTTYTFSYKFKEDGTYTLNYTYKGAIVSNVGGMEVRSPIDDSQRETGTYSLSGNKISFDKDTGTSISSAPDSFKITKIDSKEFKTDTDFTYKKS